MLPLQTIISNQSDQALAGAADMASLLSSTKKYLNSMNISQNTARMKCYFHHEQNCFCDDPVPDDAVIMSDVPFQYKERNAGIWSLMVTKQV